jgi:hypothetical protein
VKRLGTLWGMTLMLTFSLCALLASNTAQAQDDNIPELSRNWNVRIGIYIFNSESAGKVAGRVGISGMVERTVYRGDTYDVNVGIGYNGYDRVYSVPLTLTGILHPHNLRLGAGVGYSFNKRLDGRSSNGSIFTLLVGYQLTHGKNPTSVDLRYHFVSGSNSELDGYGLTYGIRF